MNRCWYCNNELTTSDSSKHFGICNKCYDEMFKSSDAIIRSFINKIADLEANRQIREVDKFCGSFINNLITQIEEFKKENK